MFFKKFAKKSQKLLVSIGAGQNQIPLIKEAKTRGFRVIGVDINPAAAGIALCDLKVYESAYDYEAIYTAVTEAFFEGTISGIMTRSYGKAVQTAAFLCQSLGFPYLPFDISLKLTDKKETKNILANSGISVPEYIRPISVKSGRLFKLKEESFPIIKKPAFGHGKSGVKLIASSEELKNEIREVDIKSCIFEKYISGDEIIALGIIHNGSYHLIDITDKELLSGHKFIDIMHTSPSKYLHLKDAVAEIGQRAARALKIQCAPLVMELIADEKEKLWLIEAVPEFGGEFLADIAVPMVLRYNYIGEAINSHTGLQFRPPMLKKNRNAFAVRYLTAKEMPEIKNGVLHSYNDSGISGMDGIVYFQMFKSIGSPVPPIADNRDRIGVVIAQGKNPEAAAETARRAEAALDIRVRSL